MPSHLAHPFARKAARARARGRVLLLAAACLCLVAAAVPRASSGSGASQHVGPAGGAKRAAVEFAPGEVLVQFRDGETSEVSKYGRAQAMRLRAGATEIEARVERLAGAEAVVEGLHLARVEPSETLAAVEALRARPDVLRAEPNFIRRALRAPNDAQYASQWNMKNASYPGFDIAAEAAWDVTTGSRSVVVGVIDTGIDVNHEDLKANVWTNTGDPVGDADGDGNADDDGSGYADDTNGWDFFNDDRTVYDGPGLDSEGEPLDSHGTHVAGIIGAEGDNGLGVAGVNWQASLMSLKFLGPDGSGRTSDLLRAYAYAKRMRELWGQTGGAKGANLRVLNNSYGGGGFSEMELAAVRSLSAAGILFVAAAGNDRLDNDRYPHYPANYDSPNVVAVAGTARYQAVYASTNYGARTVHVYAPGAEVYSTIPGGLYRAYSGTSMASPHVAGIAALALAARPDLSMERVRASVIYGGALFSPDFKPTTVTGRRVSAALALQNAADADSTPPAAVGNLRLASEPRPEDPAARQLAWTAPGDDGAAGAASLYEIRYADSAAGLDTPEGFARALRFVAPLPKPAGSGETHAVRLPFRHPDGFLAVRAVDNVGNAGPVSVLPVQNPVDIADPYTVTTGAPEQLSTGGTPMNLRADDDIKSTNLPFPVTYFNRVVNAVTVSTNGTLNFGYFDTRSDPDAVSLTTFLPALPRIAGLWDDLRTDRRAGDDVYVVRPDHDRVIFRWQAVTFDTPTGPSTSRGENPVNFEIELRRDGTIVTRYGDGNQKLWPVVGASGGEPEVYLVESHTSDMESGVSKSLQFAPTVTFTPRRPTPPPRPDLAVGIRTQPAESVGAGQLITYMVDVGNDSEDAVSEQTTVALQLPAGTSFVSCQTARGTCSGPAAGADGGTVTAQLGTLFQKYSGNSSATITVTARVNAAPGATLTATASISGNRADPNPANNTAAAATLVRQAVSFGGVRALSAGGGGNFGSAFTVALKSDGSIWGWGNTGPLGDGSGTGSVTSPVLALGLGDATAVDAGGAHVLALKGDGTVWAWGDNYYGQAGASEQFNWTKPRPTLVAGLSGTFTAVSAGASHSLAVRSDGTVWAWGHRSPVGVTSGEERVHTPVQVAGLTGVVAVSAGAGYSLALKSDGTVWAWGSNQNGTLAQPYSTFYSATPLQIASLSNVAAVAAGDAHALALKTDGTVWAWGENSYSQLGTPENPGSNVPAAVPGLAGVASISAGHRHSVAARADGTAWAWGRNLDGVLGDGSDGHRQSVVRVQGLGSPAVTAVAAGSNHSGAVLADGSVRMWGANGDGQLGDGTRVTRFSQVEVAGPPPVSTPVFSPDGGDFSFPHGVTLNVATPGSIIYYTTDGSDPDEADGAVSPGSTIFLSQTTTLKARAYKPGWQPSAVKTAVFTFPAATPTPTPGPVAGAAGQPIAFARQTANGSDIFIMNADGSGAVNLTNLPGDDMQPAWSPDGTQIAFMTFRGHGGTGKICVMNADGSELRVLSNTAQSDGSPAWSPDGRRIAFISSNSGFPSFLHVMSADGALRYPVNVNLPNAGTPQWSPDGDKLIFTVFGGPGDIWEMQLIGGTTRRLTVNGFDDHSPVYSPDGKKIAFSSNRNGDLTNYEIYVMNADGTNPVRLTNSPGVDNNPSWSPDGTKIIFGSTRDGAQSPKLYVMNADGTDQRRVSDPAASDAQPVWRRRQPATVEFASAAYSAGEGDRQAVVTLTRTDDLESAVSVEFATADDQASVRCDDAATAAGRAFARCDYATTVDALTFAPGQTQKTITIPLVDDAYREGDETVRVVINRPDKALLGARREVTLTIADNDSAAAANPLNAHAFFVRMHYLDFLSREPEAGEPWTNVLAGCADAFNTDANSPAAGCDRMLVSSAFFRSPEFQLKGLFVFKFYRVAFGRLPLYEEITADMRRVAGQTAEEVQAKRDAYAAAWSQRPDFRSRFDNLNDTAYVDKLLSNVGLQQLAGAVTRETLINDLVTARRTRAGVLRAVVEHPDVEAREYNGAFVAMQYYGYLRRSPEQSGYDAWLDYLNRNPQDFRTMVNGFVNSQEYRLRFGQP